MNTNLIKAADDARRLLKGFKAFAEVADALDAAGQLEQRAVEVQRALDDLQPKVDAATAYLAAASAKAADTLALASQQASSLVAEAKEQADEVRRSAQAAASMALNDAAQAVTGRKAEMVSAAAARDGALVKRDALQVECGELETRLAKAKSSIAKLLG